MKSDATDLKLNSINKLYFEMLRSQFENPNHEPPLNLGKNVFPSAIAPRELLSELPVTSLGELNPKAEIYLAEASRAALWIKKFQAGGGTSIKRVNYLKDFSQTHLGAKGTDLFVKRNGKFLSLAELQVLQAAKELECGSFSEIYFHDLVGQESQGAIKKLWQEEDVKEALGLKNFNHFGETYQSALPTLNENKDFSLNRVAPGGHGFFAFETLLALENKDQRPPTSKPLVSVIGNGEDLSSTPDPLVIGWVIKEKIPIAMITTEKTEIDLKGGQISLATENDRVWVTIVEQAQAKSLGRGDYFEKIGLEIKKQGQHSYFNTNVAVLNYEELNWRLKKLREKIGEKEFIKSISPSLILNKKTQEDVDGSLRNYAQMEGAMGSCLLNLDRAWRKNFNEPLVHFLNIDREHRTQFFSPIKTAFDFFMLFNSDRFKLDENTLKLVDHRPGTLPSIDLKNDFYRDVKNVLQAFAGTKILFLDKLSVEGSPVKMGNLDLKGAIQIKNDADFYFDLGLFLKKKGISSLSNQRVRILTSGEVDGV